MPNTWLIFSLISSILKSLNYQNNLMKIYYFLFMGKRTNRE